MDPVIDDIIDDVTDEGVLTPPPPIKGFVTPPRYEGLLSNDPARALALLLLSYSIDEKVGLKEFVLFEGPIAAAEVGGFGASKVDGVCFD